ncbi:MAG: PilN domain-containing protein [Candidatus Methylomirabilia bacterium]
MPRRLALGIDLRQDEARLALLAQGFRGVRLIAATVLPRRSEESPQVLGQAIQQWLARDRRQPGRVVVGLPRQEVFIRRLTLPAVKREELRQGVEYELGRHLPVPAEKVGFDVLAQRRERDGRWRLLLVAAPRSAVGRAVALVAAMGETSPVVSVPPVAHWALHSHWCREFSKASAPHVLVDVDSQRVNVEVVTRADGIAVSRSVSRPPGAQEPEVEPLVRSCLEALPAEETGEDRPTVHAMGPNGLLLAAGELSPLTCISSPPLGESGVSGTAMGLAMLGLKPQPIVDLRTPVPVPSTKQRTIRVATALLGSLLLLWAGWWTWQALEDRSKLQKLSAERRGLAPLVVQVERGTQEADRLRGLLVAFEQIKTREISKLAMLRELTVRVPGEAWLAQLVYKRGELEVIGYAPQAQPLIALLEGSAVLKEVTFSGDIQQEEGSERFKIRMSVAKEGDRAR